MRHLLSTILAVHWTVLFGFLAFLCAAEPDAAGANLLAFFNLADGAAARTGGGAELAAFFGLAFSVTASIFLWMLAECMFGRPQTRGVGVEQSGRKAFGAATVAILLFLCLGTSGAPPGHAFLVAECLLAAVLVSYLAVCAEQIFGRFLAVGEAADADAARSMALNAAQQTLLFALSGRPQETYAGRS